MLPVKKTDSRNLSLLDTGMYAICGGVAVSMMYPALALYSNSMTALGAAGMLYYFMTWSKFDKIFKALGLNKGNSYPIKKAKKRTENSIIYYFTLPSGLCVDDFIREQSAIEQALGKEVSIRYTYKEILIEVYLNELKTLYKYEVTQCPGEVAFPVGYNRKGDIVICDLSKGEPHMLIAGETGGGKSTVLRSIITNLILTKDVKLHLIDLKGGTEFAIFAKCNKVETFSRTKEEAEISLKKIIREVERRYDLFYRYDVVDIKEYNSKFEKLGYEVVVIDEFADLQKQKNSISSVEELAAKARACGVHLLISTQRPDKDIVNGKIKANITTILGLKTTNRTNSEIIIDKSRLEFLRGNGHAIFKKGAETEIQCPFLPPEKARELLRPTYIEKKKERAEEISDFSFLDLL